ncbi:MAG: hypothetical protein DI536_28915 [Archangium gephyra]|uniref:Phage tail tape measure protein domain-containing protein n=1 Tax=Archangium gephyra TaxID=48 RepID=A0A2W5SVV9_9BACT|nr:MAG: hypothetical protein DI536_28915 [Archangium gephyra]
MAKLESLIVDLQANTAKLEKGLSAANQKLANFDKQMKALVGVFALEKIGAAAISAAGALAQFVGEGINALDQMGKRAALFGESSEDFSKLAWAFKQTGVEGEEFGKFMQGLGKNLTAAASGSKEQSALFTALGVSATDAAGNVRSSSVVMGELADKFAAMEDGPAKAQLAIELFGKGGEAMLETLNKGSAGLVAAGAEAEKYGAVVSGSAAEAAGGFNDRLTKLSSIADGFAMTLAADVLPSLNKLLDSVMRNEALTTAFTNTLKGLGEATKWAAYVGTVLVAVWDKALETIGHLASAALGVVTGQFSFAIDQAKEAAKSWSAVESAAAKADNDWFDAPAPEAAAGPQQTRSAEKVLRAAKAGEAALDAQKKATAESKKALEDLTKVAEDYERKITTFGNSDPTADLAERLKTGDLAEKLEKVGDQAGAMRDRILEAARALAKLEDAKFDKKLAVDLEFSRAATRSQSAQRGAAFAKETDAGKWQQSTAGFANFDAALKAWEAATNEAAEASARMAKAARDGNQTAEVEYRRAAVAAQEAASKAESAMGGFEQFRTTEKAIDAAFKEAAGAESWGESLKKLDKSFGELGRTTTFGDEVKLWAARMGPMLASSGTQLLGAVGDLVNSVADGAKQGGVWGAIMAAFMEIAKKTESAMKFLGIAMEFIEQIAAMVEPLVKPIFDALTNVLGVVVKIVEPVFAALVPLFESIGSLVNSLAPILYSLGDLFAAIAPILEFLGRIIGVIFDALAPVFELISGVIKVIASVLLGIIIAANEIAAFFGDTKARAESDRLKGVLEAMWSRTAEMDRAAMDAAGANLENAAAAKESTEALKEFSSSLTNAPAGFRYAAAAFDAQGFGSESVFGNVDTELDITLNIDGETLYRHLQRIARRDSFRTTGFAGNLR